MQSLTYESGDVVHRGTDPKVCPPRSTANTVFTPSTSNSRLYGLPCVRIVTDERGGKSCVRLLRSNLFLYCVNIFKDG